jgi:hypothetical protein
MRFKQIFSKTSKRAHVLKARLVVALAPLGPIERPIFILGCGRSGTTILGTALSCHPQVTYLNEPRKLWAAYFPETDLYAPEGKLVLNAQDTTAARSEKLRRLFKYETIKTKKPVLVEKLPLNSFRLSFIYEIFPDARFVHIVRNGLEVAKSIEKLANKGNWFGNKDHKWNQLANYAASRDSTANLPDLCHGNYEKGLLEWRLSTEAIYSFFQQVSEDSIWEITYDDLVENPVQTLNKTLSYIGLQKSVEVDNFARNNIQRISPKKSISNVSEPDSTIGGALLRRFYR